MAAGEAARSSAVLFRQMPMRRRMGSTNASVRSAQRVSILEAREAGAIRGHRVDLSRNRSRVLGTLAGRECEDQATVAIPARIATHAAGVLLLERSHSTPQIHPEHARLFGNGNVGAVLWAHLPRHRYAYLPASDLQALREHLANRENPPPELGNLLAGERRSRCLLLFPPGEIQNVYMPPRHYIH